MYLNPETVSGIGVSLQIVFAAIAGGMYSLLGPTVGALFTIALNEGLRIWFGTNFIGAANTIYGILLMLFIIFMPQGIVGLIEGISARSVRGRARRAADAPPPEEHAMRRVDTDRISVAPRRSIASCRNRSWLPQSSSARFLNSVLLPSVILRSATAGYCRKAAGAPSCMLTAMGRATRSSFASRFTAW